MEPKGVTIRRPLKVGDENTSLKGLSGKQGDQCMSKKVAWIIFFCDAQEEYLFRCYLCTCLFNRLVVYVLRLSAEGFNCFIMYMPVRILSDMYQKTCIRSDVVFRPLIARSIAFASHCEHYFYSTGASAGNPGECPTFKLGTQPWLIGEGTQLGSLTYAHRPVMPIEPRVESRLE
uniref:Uncharacterized protein n=1 Tax=Steinernema glaseri TaxID=37863 RepID=A0A1I8AAL8_9BILA